MENGMIYAKAHILSSTGKIGKYFKLMKGIWCILERRF
jgi:hypothetical protein